MNRSKRVRTSAQGYDEFPEKISAGEPGAAGMVNAFLNKVEAQRGKSLSEAEADALVALAQKILDELS